MRHRCLLLFFVSSLLFAQNDIVEGTVVNGITGAAVSAVRVLLFKRDGPHYETDTDSAGRFRVTEIRPGTYSARFDKDGFVSLQLYSNDSFSIVPGKQPPPAKVQLLPFAQIRGRVLSSEGTPVANAEVELGRSMRDAHALSTVTNGEGEFSFESVAPGSYVLKAAPKSESQAVATEAAVGPEAAMRPTATYFPSVIDFAQAGKISVQAGTELTGYDVHLQARPVYKVRGVVLNPEGKPTAHALVRLIPKADSCSLSSGLSLGTFRSAMPGAEAGAETDDDGAFEFSAVRPGSWELAAASAVGGGVVSALVADKNIDELRIQTEHFVDLEGSIEWGDQTEATGDEYGMLFLCNLDQQLTFFIPMNSRRRFRQPNLPPGRYRLAPTPYPVHGKTLNAVFLGDRDVLGEEVELTAGSPPIRVVYGTTPGILEGRVDQGDCAVVLLLPKPFVFLETPFGARCTAGGRFQITGVAAGDYYTIALDDFDTSTPLEPDFLRKLLPLAATITITTGSTSTLNLRSLHWPD